MDRIKAISYCDHTIAACLCILIFCLPFTKSGVEIFIWIAFFLWILKRFLGYKGESLWKMLPKTELNKALGVFIAVNLLSVIGSVNLNLSLRGFFFKLLKMIILYFIIAEVINSKKKIRNRFYLKRIIASHA